MCAFTCSFAFAQSVNAVFTTKNLLPLKIILGIKQTFGLDVNAIRFYNNKKEKLDQREAYMQMQNAVNEIHAF